MNSSAAIKAFTGRHGGTVCTSSNARTALEWAFDQVGGVAGDGKVLFLPDQHLGRNTAVRELGLSLDDCVVWDPHRPNGGLTPEGERVLQWARRIVSDARTMREEIRIGSKGLSGTLRLAVIPTALAAASPRCRSTAVNVGVVVRARTPS